ncbi:MAG: hypothetical protein ACREJU_18555 [Nitrospiraceae bacterium]
MPTTTGAVKTQSNHDVIVKFVAQRWAKTMRCKVMVNTDSAQNGWKTVERKYPDLVGWQFNTEGNTVEWIAEVETEDSFSELDAHGRWRDYMDLGLQFYLFVPKGYGATAQFFASRAGVRINRIYEYIFVNEKFQLA